MRRSTLTSSCACFDDYVSNEAFRGGTVIRCTFESIFDNQQIDKMNCDSSLLSGNTLANLHATSWFRFRVSSPSVGCHLPLLSATLFGCKTTINSKILWFYGTRTSLTSYTIWNTLGSTFPRILFFFGNQYLLTEWNRLV